MMNLNPHRKTWRQQSRGCGRSSSRRQRQPPRPAQTGAAAYIDVLFGATRDDVLCCCPDTCRAEHSHVEAVICSRCSRWYGPEAPRWLGPLPYDYPDWLPEDVPANYGFDVAALSAEEVSAPAEAHASCCRRFNAVFYRTSLVQTLAAAAETFICEHRASSTGTSSWSCCMRGGPCWAHSARCFQVRVEGLKSLSASCTAA